MDNKKLIVGIGIVAVLALVFSLTLRGASTGTVNVQDAVNAKVEDLASQLRRELSLGASPGDTIPGNRLCVGGVCQYRFSQALKQATTTVCSFAIPRNNKVMVLTNATIDIQTATGTAWTFRMGTSTTGSNAVSTFLLQKTLTNADVLNYVASSTASSGAFVGTGIFGTTTQQYINVDLGGTALLPLTPVTRGSCSIILNEVQ